MDLSLNRLIQMLLGLFAFIISGSVHEFAHAFAAWKFGDHTAKQAGRLTFNPVAHIDIIGSIFFPLFCAISGAPVIGWMKPVPVNRYNLGDPSKEHALTSFAGPLSNFVQATVWIVVLKLMFDLGVKYQGIFEHIYELVGLFFQINLFLMVFNLLPMPPLDGGWILRHFLPERGKEFYDQYMKYGFIILFVLLIAGGLSVLFTPINGLINTVLSNIGKVHFLIFCIPAVLSIGILTFFLKDDLKRMISKHNNSGPDNPFHYH